MIGILTTREAARLLSDRYATQLHEWQVRRLFEDGDLPEPPKFGGKRMVAPELLPEMIRALAARGWIPLEAAAE
jgi:hypothetical protein